MVLNMVVNMVVPMQAPESLNIWPGQ